MSEPAKVIDLVSRIKSKNKNTDDIFIPISDSTGDHTKVEFKVPSGYDVKIELVKKETKPEVVIKDDNMGYIYGKKETTTAEFSNNYVDDNSSLGYRNINRTFNEYFYEKLGTLNQDVHRIIERRDTKSSEVSEMILKLDKLFKIQIKFLIEGLTLVLFSLIGFIMFYRTGNYLLHPSLYIVTLIMGLGWSLTALWSIKTNKDDLRND